MGDLRFEWDDRKIAANRRKHGVSFEEAETVFLDEQALLMADDDHSNGEERYLLLGMSASLRILVVCHTYRGNDDVIRIISAWKATKSERRDYFERWKS